MKALENYIRAFPSEVETAQVVAELLGAGPGAFDRKRPGEHITASAFVIDQAAAQVLLVQHRVLDRWLQPG